MTSIYEQSSLDGLAVFTRVGAGLDFTTHQYPETVTSKLERDDVRDLRDALNRWLDEQQRNDPDPAGRNTAPPYETLIRRAVAEEVARVLPLHQSPQAAVCNERGCQAAGPEYASNTGLALCASRFCNRVEPHADHALDEDPEPQAVGHPEAPGVYWRDRVGLGFDYCHSCGHSWSRHGVGAGNCNVRLGGRECGCESIRSASVCECGHAWVDHGRFNIRGCGVLPCDCMRPVPWGNRVCLVCDVEHVGAHPLQPCKCGHCSRQHAGSYGYGDCGKCECARYSR